MKHSLIAALMSIFVGFQTLAQVDVYNMTIVTSIPRVYDNMSSTGYRKYQSQKITGYVSMTYSDTRSSPKIEFFGFTNHTHKTSSNAKITYEIYEDEYAIQRLSAVGSNKTGKFTRGTAFFDLVFYPSYGISDIVTEDNSLYLKFASINGTFGTMKNGRVTLKRMSGKVVGTVGCSCADYGHKSPTRLFSYWGPSYGYVTDVATTIGTWKLVYNSKLSCP